MREIHRNPLPLSMIQTAATLAADFVAAGILDGGVLLIHSSLSSLGSVDGGPDAVIDALLRCIGPRGTLLVPTLSYLFVNSESPVFNVVSTPSNVGAVSAAILRRSDAIRSLHPTHSVAAIGPLAEELTRDHDKDQTAVGDNSPFRKLKNYNNAQIAFLGCGSRCNTYIHGVEECLLPSPPPYLFKPAVEQPYTVVDKHGRSQTTNHRVHDFSATGQRYERLCDLVPAGSYRRGVVGAGSALEVFEARALWHTAFQALSQDPLALVAPCPKGENHYLKPGKGINGLSYFSYTVEEERSLDCRSSEVFVSCV